ncbi:uncharacterized protein J3R85_016389 [Psidium guajava]|nr:uncharacterized protein J3R85_016389 [Psidium guajava]
MVDCSTVARTRTHIASTPARPRTTTRTAMASSSPCVTGGERKHWWLTNRKAVGKYLKDAKYLMASHEPSEIASALSLLDSALALSPRLEPALELRARCLLQLRRFKDVADMLQDYIPSLKVASDDTTSSSTSSSSSSSSLSSSDGSSQQLSRERVKLLPSPGSTSRDLTFKCFSVSDLKRKVMAGLCKNCDKEGQWRYLVLGQACCHLGLMEDAMVLLQTGKRLATAAFRRESVSWSDDSFCLLDLPVPAEIACPNTPPGTPPRAAPFASDPESVNQLLSHIKLLRRRRAAALAALDVGLHSEAIRHLTKIVDSRRGNAAPQGFLAECYMHRASAYRSAGRVAESIADCNRTLALDPTCIQALETRAQLLEGIRCIPDCLHDLEHLKLLYNTILRDRKLPGPAWKHHHVQYREIPGRLCTLTTKIQELKQLVASGKTGNVDYYGLIGLRRGCSRSELDRAHLLLSLKHKPDKAMGFIERCEFADERDLESVRDRSRMSALLLYRLIQKGYNSIVSCILEEEVAGEKQRKQAAAAAIQAAAAIKLHPAQESNNPEEPKENQAATSSVESANSASNRILPGENKNTTAAAGVGANGTGFQGVFCRDLAAVSSLLSQVGINRPLPMKYEALSC